MIFTPTPLNGVFVIEPQRNADSRGYFERTYCVEEFQKHGINCNFLQDSISFNLKKNTLRGMHYQKEPFGEEKIVRCISGGVYDVVVDMMETSSTYLQWFAIELTAENGKALYIPKGFAHGFQTLCDNTALYYKISEVFHAEVATGIPYYDPKINIDWKNLHSELTISDKDREWKMI